MCNSVTTDVYIWSINVDVCNGALMRVSTMGILMNACSSQGVCKGSIKEDLHSISTKEKHACVFNNNSEDAYKRE